MTQNEKELLMKDLCTRVPYGVKYMRYSWDFEADQELPVIETLECVDQDGYINHRRVYTVDDIKPYLFPLSSMTEEQKEEYYSLADDVTIKPGQGSYFGIKIHCIKLGISDNPHEGVWDDVDLDAIDWLNKNHFDYRGLIPMGLANDATGLNIY